MCASMNRLEDTSVASWRHTSTTPEQPPKEGGVLVTDRKADFVNRLIRSLEQVLRLFDAKVLHVVDQRKARRLLEAPFQCALRNPRVPDDTRNDARLSEVFPEPRFAATHNSVGMRLLADERLVRQLPLVMPLQQVDFRDTHCLSRTHVPGDDVQGKVMPRGGAARGDDAAGGVGEAEIGLRPEAHLRVLAPEQILITP